MISFPFSREGIRTQEKYTYDKTHEALAVYKTTDPAHPGVQTLFNQGDWLLGGRRNQEDRRYESNQ
jgi:ATP sulfurylase